MHQIPKHVRTIVSAAFVALIFGRGRSTFGAGGGRAAVCGDAASALSAGTTTGGESANGGFCDCGVLDDEAKRDSFSMREKADIMARRCSACIGGYDGRKTASRRREARWRRWRTGEAMVAVEERVL